MSWISRFIRRTSHRLYPLVATRNSLSKRPVCFFIPDKSRGWILEAVCNEIAQRLDTPTVFCGEHKKLPLASAYFFCHYSFFVSALRYNPELANENCVVWFTHPKHPDLGGPETIQALRKANVVTMCSRWREFLIEKGLQPERVTTIVGAADPDFFQPHQRGGGKVGFCTAYYERKSPERILETIQSLPEIPCVLLGRKWDEYPKFDELMSLPNFEYREAGYEEYPTFYSELDVFVSVSAMEGGPIPLLESMMCNVVPVASDTGFAPDVIQHGDNGFLFPAASGNGQQIASLVRQARQLTCDVRASVLDYNWDNYARSHDSLFRAAA